VSVLIALITWKLTKDKERNELKEKYKDSARKEVVEYLGKLRDTAKNLINFKNEYDKVSQMIATALSVEKC
jgi:cytochrome oxidase assembly protein ShyY1